MKVIQPVILNAGDPNGVRAIAVRKVKRLKLESNIDRPDPVSDGPVGVPGVPEAAKSIRAVPPSSADRQCGRS